MTLKPEHIVEELNRTPKLKRDLIMKMMEVMLDSEAFLEAYPTLYDPRIADAENATAKEMLLTEKENCKRAFLELRVAQDAVLDAKFAGHRPDNVQFKFDFPNREVTCRW